MVRIMQVRRTEWWLFVEPELASLAIPGLGHLLQGKWFRALLWFLPAAALWMLVIHPDSWQIELILLVPVALGFHIGSSQAVSRHRTGEAPAEIPLFVRQKVLGMVLMMVAGITMLLVSGVVVEEMTRSWSTASSLFHMAVPRLARAVSQCVMMGGIGVVGFWLFQLGNLSQRRAEEQTRQHILMEQARQHGGTLTVPEAAIAARISLEEAQQMLEQMVQQRIIGLSLRENGQKVYHFFEGDGPKQAI
jgi:hypothetical protein